MLPARGEETIPGHPDDVFVVIIKNRGKRCTDEKENQKRDSHHGPFVFLQSAPGFLSHGAADHFGAVFFLLVEQSHIFIPFRSIAL